MSQSTPIAVSGNKGFGGSKSKSGFDGVSFHKASGKWIAFVQLADRKRKQVPGLHLTPKSAHDARVAFIAANSVAAPTEARSRKAATVTTGTVA